MTAKSKEDFLYQLHNELHRIGIDDDDEEIFADFEAHFRESEENGFSEEETCEKLGDVKEIARSYLDIPSERINSIVANNVSNARVSLTKPGEKLPADLSLLKDKPPAEEQPIREFTPEHIAEESEPPKSAVPRANLGESPVREVTPEQIAAEQPSAAQTQPKAAGGDMRYQYRSTASAAQSGSEAFSKEHKSEMPENDSMPKVGKFADKGGFKFVDIKGMKPHINVGKLVGCIVLDVLLWIWLVPLAVSGIVGGLGGTALSLATNAFIQLFSGDYYHPISRILLCIGMVSGAVLVLCAVIALLRLVIIWIKNIVIDHIKAIYGL